MKLFLASEAKHPESMEKLRAYVGGFERKRIAYIPTAYNGENAYGTWKEESSTWKLVQTLNAHITPVVLEEYKNDSVRSALENQDIIWFAGGSCGYLMYWVRRCGIDAFLPELLQKSAVYVGSSAGSMITAPTLNLVRWYIGEEERGAKDIPSLHLVDFEIYPHYEDHLLPEIQKHATPTPLYLLKNGEAITVTDGVITVLGEERIIRA